MDAIILAGGLGTRLAQTLPHLPKALAPIQGIPFLHLLLKQIEKGGFISKVVLALGHKANKIEEFIRRKRYTFQVECSIEPSPLGTGGAILYSLSKVKSSSLLIMNGDSYFDLSLSSFLQFHQSKGGVASIACRAIEDPSRYGTLHINSSGQILAFLEKSSLSQSRWINGGVYLFEKILFDSVPLGTYSLEKDFFPRFLEKGVCAYPHSGTFIDIGTQASYLEAQQLLKPWISQ